MSRANGIITFFVIMAGVWVVVAVFEKVGGAIDTYWRKEGAETAGMADAVIVVGIAMLFAMVYGWWTTRSAQRREMAEIRTQLAEIQRTQERMAKILFPENEADDG